MYNTISEIRRRHAGHWFSESTMRFFGTRIESGVIGGRYFVTSEDNFDRTERLFTVRRADDSGDIETVGEFQDYEERANAITAAKLAAGQEGSPE
jgi:hypothetical protein